MSMHLFEVLADPTRRRLVESLMAGEQPVHELIGATRIHQSGVSRHLGILHEAGFVKVRRAGALRFYSLRREPLEQLEEWVGRYRAVWERRLDRFARALDARRRRR